MQSTKRDRSKNRLSIVDGDERVIAVVRQFPIVMRKTFILGLLIIVLALIPWIVAYATLASWINYAYLWIAVCAVFLFMYWLRAWVGWKYSIYVLTDQRLMVVKQSGFFSRDVSDLALHNIQSVNYRIKGFQGAMFGFGTVDVDTLSGSGSMQLTFVKKPAAFQKKIMDEVNKVSSSRVKEETEE